jgi:hypothetical protein
MTTSGPAAMLLKTAAVNNGFGEKSPLMVQYAEVFPDAEIVAAVLRQSGWTHFTLRTARVRLLRDRGEDA